MLIFHRAEINHFTMVNRQNAGLFGTLEPVAIGINVTLYLFVAGLLAMYYLLPVQIVCIIPICTLEQFSNCARISMNVLSWKRISSAKTLLPLYINLSLFCYVE